MKFRDFLVALVSLLVAAHIIAIQFAHRVVVS